MNNKFEYFLNAIHYNMYLEEMWSNKKFERIVDKLNIMVVRIPFIGKYIRNNNKLHTKETNDFIYSNKNGLSIGVAHHCFGYFYSGYPTFLSFVLLGIMLRFCGEANHITRLFIIALPIGLCYIPAYKAVFTNDRYLKYFKRFEKKDERWHKKWKRITIAFCIGSVLAGILGIGAMWFILLL